MVSRRGSSVFSPKMAEVQAPDNVIILPPDIEEQQEPPVAEQQVQQNPPNEIAEQIKALQAQLAVLNAAKTDKGGVPAAFQLVRQLASAPPRLRDPAMIMNALQNLADEARYCSDTKAAQYEVVLSAGRTCINHSLETSSSGF
ncbi:uncharacterized protein LOC116618839 [Nematostella vectensis]|uniref:uncharacterized protein LOC116618839 n=1 Tax=Nematostella vectensis TaxID=45351 RepID=UPI00138FFC54|nr:uncharacterized protein LOC116618839 [Nematostella vectensis]